jgi:riboflavin biosynthesis pyrimidine reductase
MATSTSTEQERPTDSAPLITEYRWHHDCISGLIFSEEDAGRQLTTSPVCEKWSAAGTLHVRTVSGTVFRLGDEAQARSARQLAGRPSVLDQLDLAFMSDLLEARSLRCLVGGVEAGGHATSSLLRSSVCVDEGVLHLQGSRTSARRVVLLRQGGGGGGGAL